MKLAIGFVLFTAAAFADVTGTVQNLTSGKPQAGATVTLVELGSGMNNVGSVKTDASGNFTFKANTNPASPYLIQAIHHGVTYNKMLSPGTAGQPVSLDVYSAATKVPEAKVTQDMILIERNADQIVVNETVILTNEGKTTWQDPNGTLRIQVPAGVTGPVKMRLTAPQGMPISREPDKGSAPNTWVVKYPIKPGETRVDFSYTMPASGESVKFASKILHGGGPVRFVAPQGVKLEGAALSDLGPEPRTQASVYELKGAEFAINVSGSGQLRAAAAEQPASGNGGGAPAEESDTPGIDMVKPRIYGRMPWVVGLTFAMLALGFIAMYNRGGSQA